MQGAEERVVGVEGREVPGIGGGSVLGESKASFLQSLRRQAQSTRGGTRQWKDAGAPVCSSLVTS